MLNEIPQPLIVKIRSDARERVRWGKVMKKNIWKGLAPSMAAASFCSVSSDLIEVYKIKKPRPSRCKPGVITASAEDGSELSRGLHWHNQDASTFIRCFARAVLRLCAHVDLRLDAVGRHLEREIERGQLEGVGGRMHHVRRQTPVHWRGRPEPGGPG